MHVIFLLKTNLRCCNLQETDEDQKAKKLRYFLAKVYLNLFIAVPPEVLQYGFFKLYERDLRLLDSGKKLMIDRKTI